MKENNGNEKAFPKRTLVVSPATPIPRAKRRLRQSQQPVADDCDLVFGTKDLATLIFSYIGVRDLYNFTMTSKNHMKILTHEQVVDSAMIHKGLVKTSMERLVALIKARKIWTPSPLRMLRLMNGKRCEKCNRNKVNSVSKMFGVLFCTRECIRVGYNSGRGGYAKPVPRNDKWSAFIDHERTTKIVCSDCVYVFTDALKDASGELCGPIVTKSQYELLLQENPAVSPNMKPHLLDKLFQSLDRRDKYACHQDTILDALKRGRGELTSRQKETKERKEKAAAKANEARKQRILDILGNLCYLVGDVPWKDVLLAFEFTTDPGENKIFARFKNELVTEQLGPLAQAPSRATKKKLREVAATLTEQFGILQSTGFHDFSFLRESHHPLDKRLWEHFHERDDIQLYHLCTHKALDLIRQGELVDALHVLLPSEVREVAVSGIVATVPAHFANTYNLAIAHWGQPESATMRYEECVLKFPKLYQEAVFRGLVNAPQVFF